MHASVSCARGKCLYEPPVIETFYPSSMGLPPDVVDEWSGKCLLRPETNEDARRLRLVRSYGSVAGWRRIFRTTMATLGLQHQEPPRIG